MLVSTYHFVYHHRTPGWHHKVGPDLHLFVVAVDKIQSVIRVQISSECRITRKYILDATTDSISTGPCTLPIPSSNPEVSSSFSPIFPPPLKSNFPSHPYFLLLSNHISLGSISGPSPLLNQQAQRLLEEARQENRLKKKTNGWLFLPSFLRQENEKKPMERHFQEIKFFRMLEEAVCTLKEQVNIYEQEVDQVWNVFCNPNNDQV